jgi:tetratricopeptide (TPR) repeat protein
MLSYMLDYSLWGLNSFGYHLQNIFWHIIAVIVVYKCFRLFNIKAWIAFFLCLIFAVHPQRVESVVWLSERKDVLCAAFYFLCIYYYMKNYDRKFSSTAFVFFILSILSKPMAISLPVILLIYEFYRFGKERWKIIDSRLETKGRGQWSENMGIKSEVRKQEKNTKPISGYMLRVRPFLIILLVFIPVTIIAQGQIAHSHTQIFSFLRLYTVFYNICWYFLQTLLPIELNPIYPAIHPYSSIFELLLFYAAVIVILIILFYKNRKLFIYCILPLALAYIVSLLPIVGLIKLGSIDHADRYSYISSVFIWFSIGLILTRLLYNNNFAYSQLKKSFLLNRKFIFVILFLYSGILTESNYQYQKIWKSEYGVFLYASKCIPTNQIVLPPLGDHELAIGNYEEVLIIAKRLEAQKNACLLAVYFKMSVAYHLGDKNAIIKKLSILKQYFKPIANETIDAKFRYLKICEMLADCYYSSGNTQKAVECINEMLQFKQLDEFGHFFCKGLKAQYQKNYRDALCWYKKAQKIKPGNKKTQENIKQCFNLQKREKQTINRHQ